MVSTYHVYELVTAITGDTIDVEMISTTNIPVHDFTPTQQDQLGWQILICSSIMD